VQRASKHEVRCTLGEVSIVVTADRIRRGALHALLALLLLAWGCTSSADLDGGWWTEDGHQGDGDAGGDDGRDEGDSADAGDDGPVDPLRLGSEGTFEIATWNLHNFPTDGLTPGRVAALLQRLDLDLIVVEEVADQAAFEALVAALPGYEAVLSDHVYSTGDYQKIGFILRSSNLQVRGWENHFLDDEYHFPRPSMEVGLLAHAPGGATRAFMVMGEHLKAGVAADDQARRRAACTLLAARVDELQQAGLADQVVLLGDFNDELTDEAADNVFQAFLDAPERYEPLSAAPYLEGTFSYITYPGMLDNLIATDSWLAGRGTPRVVVVRLDQADLGYDYESAVSDHLPVVAILPW
jgi:endonuclease/exonuclease/phosphatase family metal-dependent hydrolase